MQVKPQPEQGLSSDFAITRWDDSVLAPKNQNIIEDSLIPLPNKPYHRKQIFAAKRRLNSKNEVHQD
jgi:hypothetical protein